MKSIDVRKYAVSEVFSREDGSWLVAGQASLDSNNDEQTGKKSKSLVFSKVRQPDVHPSTALWVNIGSDGKAALGPAAQEAIDICYRAPENAARLLQPLLTSGAAHPWQRRGDGETMLHLAAASANEQLVSILLKAGADCNAKNRKGQTPLHLAVIARSSSVVEQIISYGSRNEHPQPEKVSIAVEDSLGCTPLHVAAYVGEAESCRVLLQYGADALKLDKSGRTPLHHCTTLEAAAALMEHAPGASKVLDMNGLLPSHYAALRNIFPVLSLLVQFPGATDADAMGMQPLHYAVLHDCSNAMVDRMCTACDVNAVDDTNHTALDYCIYKGDNERADLMVKNGARMDPILLLYTKCKRLTEESGSSSAPSVEAQERNREEMDVTSTCMELFNRHQDVVACFQFSDKSDGKQDKDKGTVVLSRWRTAISYFMHSCEGEIIPGPSERVQGAWARLMLPEPGRECPPLQKVDRHFNLSDNDVERVREACDDGMQRSSLTSMQALIQLQQLGTKNHR